MAELYTASSRQISVIMPALNEQDNVGLAISNSLRAFEDLGINGEIIVINDGSTDRTGDIVEEFVREDKRVTMVEHSKPMGIGASFWDGVRHATGECLCMLPGDNENDPWDILRYVPLLKHVDIVIPFVFNKEVRSVFRNILSFVYRTIINTTFLVNFNYTNGTVIYRKSLLDGLDFQSSGFFFQTDILIRTTKQDYLFAEVPVKLGRRPKGVSKALSFPSLIQVVRGYFQLLRNIYFPGPKVSNNGFATGSASARRRSSNKATTPWVK